MARRKYFPKPTNLKLTEQETIDFLGNVNAIACDLISSPKAARWSDLPINTNSERLLNFQQEWTTFQGHVLNKRISIEVSSSGFSLNQDTLFVPHQFQNYNARKDPRYVVSLFRDMSGLIMTSNRLIAVKEKDVAQAMTTNMTVVAEMAPPPETPEKKNKIARIFSVRA